MLIANERENCEFTYEFMGRLISMNFHLTKVLLDGHQAADLTFVRFGFMGMVVQRTYILALRKLNKVCQVIT